MDFICPKTGVQCAYDQTAGAGGVQAATAEAVIQGLKNLDEVRDEVKSRVRANAKSR